MERRTKELMDFNNELRRIVEIDALTGLPNRRYVMDELESSIFEWNRYNIVSSFLFIDVDNFKFVNDQYGHEVGDDLLLWIAEFLKKNTRNTGKVCCLG